MMQSEPKKRFSMKKQKEQGLPDYTVYQQSVGEYAFGLVIGIGCMSFVGYLFYQHVIGIIIFGALGLYYPRIRCRGLIERRRAQLTLQFKQALHSISSSLSAGRSIENALKEASHDLKMLYPGVEVDMMRELRIIRARMENGVPMEKAMMDFSQRANQDDISNFVDVIVTCKRLGGDLVEVVRRTSTVISEKMDIVQEIEVLIAQKRLEMKAMMVAPFFFIGFINFSSPDFMAPLYEGGGRILATVSLALLFIGIWLLKKMMNIRV
ncbi:type II secretion system F family protein [Paenibacillus agilis]|nr:type II secretion system F family protein [Paenibacillus agilis]